MLEYVRTRVKNLACMTVCETETVHERLWSHHERIKRVRYRVSFVKSSLKTVS